MKEQGKKEKRYFCDWISMFLEVWSVFIRFAVIILLIVSCFISAIVIDAKYGYQLEVYSEEDHKYLSEIAESFWDKDNKSLSLAKIPEDVNVTFNESINNGLNITLTKDIGYFFAKWPTVYIEISEDFNNYTITPLSKEGFLRNTKFTMIVTSILLGLVFIIILYVTIVLIGSVIYLISLIHKKLINKKKSPKNS